MTGYRFAGDGELCDFMGTTSYYYSAPTSSSHTAQAFNIGKYVWKDEDIVGGAAGNSGTIDVLAGKNKWEANPVRCVRESTN